MKIFGHSDPGMCRAENQDAYSTYQLRRVKKNGDDPPVFVNATLALVCDGMGGENGGATASRIACEKFTASLIAQEQVPAPTAMKQAALVANHAVYDEAFLTPALSGMGTTLVGALVEGNDLTLINIGDSRAYLLHGGTLTQLTHDHSYVQEMIDRGEITPEQARHHINRNLITRAVGVEKTVKPDVIPITWEPGDRLLLCTDGLHNTVSGTELTAILSEPSDLPTLAHELIAAANCKGGEDNITALLLENTKENQQND